MKFLKMLLVIIALGSGPALVLGGIVTEGSINLPGSAATISVDNSTLTKVPTTQDAGRVGYFVSISSSNAGSMVGSIGDCSAATYAATVRPIRIGPGSNSVFYKFADNVCLWLITTAGSAESLHVQQVYQQR
jgi:hypothetical protein